MRGLRRYWALTLKEMHQMRRAPKLVFQLTIPPTIMEGRRNKILRSKKATYAIYDNGEEILFDLEKDPHQLRNIAQSSEGADLLQQMRKALLLKTIEIRDPLPEQIRPY